MSYNKALLTFLLLVELEINIHSYWLAAFGGFFETYRRLPHFPLRRNPPEDTLCPARGSGLGSRIL
jgi:hypothetical protein